VTISPLVRRILLGAAESSLDIAGTALLPGAWPILKGALGPVLERLKQRLGGQDITSSPDLARKAADVFEADLHLQEILRSALVEKLGDLAQSQHKIDADIQKLMLIVSGDEKLLQDITGGVGRIEEHLETGVNLSDEAVEKLTAAISRQAESSRSVRAIALGATGPVAGLLERQVSRLQVRAVELVGEGAADRALDELQEGLQLVAVLLSEAPTDMSVRLSLGFIYKTFAQVEAERGRTDEAAAYIDRADEIFRYVLSDVAGNHKTALDIANAIHGQANTLQERGQFEAAISRYHDALKVYPGHLYALHDIFTAYYQLAMQGKPNLKEMRKALDDLKAGYVPGIPGLGEQHIADMEGVMQELERNAAGNESAN
jgi:tetratricopeptide (TPR) repeat protein